MNASDISNPDGNSTIGDPGPKKRTSPAVLWGAIGALAVTAAALGGVLIGQRSDPVTASTASTTQAVSAPSRQAALQPLAAPDDGTPPPMSSVVATAPAPVRAPVAAQAVPSVQTSPSPSPSKPATVARASVCATCGHVESVQPVSHATPASGVGAVAGGVLGGVLGNQIGHGGGRTAATVLGAVGGGYAGHVAEGHVRTETRYQVRVRMADGSLRTVETRTAPPLGKPVTLRDGVLRPADGRA